MASANIKEFTDANFETEVLGSETPTLVDFWAEWCGPCRQIAPTVEALAGDYAGKLKVGKVNVDQHQITAQRYGIRSIPTLLVFKGGKVVGQMVGAYPRSKMEAEIKKHIEEK
jgi:thioredoxin 1